MSNTSLKLGDIVRIPCGQSVIINHARRIYAAMPEEPHIGRATDYLVLASHSMHVRKTDLRKVCRRVGAVRVNVSLPHKTYIRYTAADDCFTICIDGLPVYQQAGNSEPCTDKIVLADNT